MKELLYRHLKICEELLCYSDPDPFRVLYFSCIFMNFHMSFSMYLFFICCAKFLEASFILETCVAQSGMILYIFVFVSVFAFAE